MLRRCATLAIFWAVWMEGYWRYFEGARIVEMDLLWDEVHFWASLWSSVSSEFRDYSIHAISYDCNSEMFVSI